jgi:hypothetical protein
MAELMTIVSTLFLFKKRYMPLSSFRIKCVNKLRSNRCVPGIPNLHQFIASTVSSAIGISSVRASTITLKIKQGDIDIDAKIQY